MERIECLLKLLESYQKILKITNSNFPTEALEELVRQLKLVKQLNIDEIVIKPKIKGTVKGGKVQNTFDLVGIRDCYSKLISNEEITENEKKLIGEFEVKYPRFRMLLCGNNESLYSAVSKNKQMDLSVDELKLLLNLQFGIDMFRRKKTKSELYSELLKNLYQSNHFDSMEENYKK